MPYAAKILAPIMLMSFVSWTIIAWVHVSPFLDKRSKRDALLVAVMPHMFRTIGVFAIFPGIGDTPEAWSLPLAWGDSATAILAALSMIALKRDWAHATKLVWVFNLVGFLDMLHNAFNAVALQVAPRLGPIAYVVGIGVPGMFVFHVLVFRTLLRAPSRTSPVGAQ